MDPIVELVTILAAPFFGLLGVWVGGTAQGHREERRLRVELESARESRLFDHKRVAHGEFIAEYLRLRSDTEENVHGRDKPPLPSAAYEELRNRWTRVWIYGSDVSANYARDVWHQLLVWANSVDQRRAAETKRLDSEFDVYMTAVKNDIGTL
jgi:hypothetical protein